MHSKIRRKVQICPIYPLPSLSLQCTHTHTHRPAHTKPPSLLTFPTRWNICYNWWTYIDTSYSKSIVYFRIHAWIVHSIVHSVGLNKLATWEVRFPMSMFSFTSIPGFIRSFPESHFRRAWGSRHLQQWTGRRRRARSRSRDRPLQQLGYNQTLPAFLSIPGFQGVPRITGSHHNTSEENLLKKTEGQDL